MWWKKCSTCRACTMYTCAPHQPSVLVTRSSPCASSACHAVIELNFPYNTANYSNAFHTHITQSIHLSCVVARLILPSFGLPFDKIENVDAWCASFVWLFSSNWIELRMSEWRSPIPFIKRHTQNDLVRIDTMIDDDTHAFVSSIEWWKKRDNALDIGLLLNVFFIASSSTLCAIV